MKIKNYITHPFILLAIAVIGIAAAHGFLLSAVPWVMVLILISVVVMEILYDLSKGYDDGDWEGIIACKEAGERVVSTVARYKSERQAYWSTRFQAWYHAKFSLEDEVTWEVQKYHGPEPKINSTESDQSSSQSRRSL